VLSQIAGLQRSKDAVDSALVEPVEFAPEGETHHFPDEVLHDLLPPLPEDGL
jgi:hypothetical protein